MSVSVVMPQLGESVTEGTVTRWLKKEGEHVTADEPLLEVSTDKVDTEIPSPASGILRGIAVDEDETVAVGAQLAVIEDSDSAAAPAPAAAPAAPVVQAPAAEAPAPPPVPAYVPPAPEPPAPVPAATAPVNGGSAAPTSTWSWSAPPTPAYAPPASPAPAAYVPPTPPAPAYTCPAPRPRKKSPPTRTRSRHRCPATRRTSRRSSESSPPSTPCRLRRSPVPGLAAGSASRTSSMRPARSVPPRPRPRHRLLPRLRRRPPRLRLRLKLRQPLRPRARRTGARADTTAAPAPAQPAIVPSALRGTTKRMSRPRQVIAKRMVESLQTSAQLTTVVEVDVTNIARLRERAKAPFQAREGVKLTFLPFFAQAAVEALKVHPVLNAVINTETQEVTYHAAEHLGIAVDTERGLMVPVIHSAGDLNIGGLARKIADLAARTRGGQVGPDELAGGTFTLTNTGSRGALFDTPIINQPQVGILGVGSVVKRAVVVEDPALGEVIAVRSMVYLALTYDHRLVDGADAARFLVTVKNRLEEGAFDADLGL